MIVYLTPPTFEQKVVLQHLHHYLPHQNPLKDFINDNVLKSFQDLPFHEALLTASTILGYKTYLYLNEYRALYANGKINPLLFQKIIIDQKGIEQWDIWEKKLLEKDYDTSLYNRLGQLHQIWTNHYHLNIEKEVHSFLFRLIGSYIDQGITLKKFPIKANGFLEAIQQLDKNSRWIPFFRSKRVKKLLHEPHISLQSLLDILVGDEAFYEQYLFDQQFAHAGWSGMVSVIENHPETLLDPRPVSLHDFILLELLLEIDALDTKFGVGNWEPLAKNITTDIVPLFNPVEKREVFEVYALWQEIYEWTFYDQVLRGLQLAPQEASIEKKTDFQAFFCIDDRECSLRRHLEKIANVATFGTAGFFNIEFYFQPEGGKFYTKSCPAPLNPHYLVKEKNIRKHHHKRDAHFSRQSRNLLGSWVISQTMGFWSAIELAWNIFKPTETPALVSSFRHMDRHSTLQYEHCENGETQSLQVGFTNEEMALRMETLLRSVGLVENFASLVYFVGHGASSVNNPHYAAYGCGACSGQTGSVNARLAAAMLNKKEVRKLLKEKGIDIPDSTQFVGALHDTTQDEILFYDEKILSDENRLRHKEHTKAFTEALTNNAKERSRRFLLIDTNKSAKKIHKQVKLRALSLFEPRSEWDHATNALCIVGRRQTNAHLFLDRRSFLNSYDYRKDKEGKYLLGILRAVAPVCGGINLQYYFACTDHYRLGAGSKLPHNVIGLVGVANGIDGDLRIGLPQQSVDIHDPIRLLVVVEHFPAVVKEVIQKDLTTYQWFENEWIHLVVIQPETKQLFRFTKGNFLPYEPITQTLPTINGLENLWTNSGENLPIYLMQ
ncbi:MAG: DUF2309 domain-containing protein [Cytophagales bacterium]|nr:MAG: DUF2309 domain-containing protein [Cytophagales bacterium]